MPSSNTSFDRLFQRLIDGIRMMKTRERQLRETAYRTAKSWVIMQRDHWNQLKTQLKSYNKGHDALIDDLLGVGNFDGLSLVGEWLGSGICESSAYAAVYGACVRIMPFGMAGGPAHVAHAVTSASILSSLRSIL